MDCCQVDSPADFPITPENSVALSIRAVKNTRQKPTTQVPQSCKLAKGRMPLCDCLNFSIIIFSIFLG